MKQETVLSQPDIEIFKLAKEREEKRSEGSKDMGKEGERERGGPGTSAPAHARRCSAPAFLREGERSLSLSLSLSLSIPRRRPCKQSSRAT